MTPDGGSSPWTAASNVAYGGAVANYEEPEDRITAEEAATLAGLDLSTVLRWCSTGQLASARCEGERNDEVWTIALAEVEDKVLRVQRRPDGTPVGEVVAADPFVFGLRWTFAAALVFMVTYVIEEKLTSPSIVSTIVFIAYSSAPIWLPAIGTWIAWTNDKRAALPTAVRTFFGSVVGLIFTSIFVALVRSGLFGLA